MEILNLYSMDVRRLRGDLILFYSLFESGQVAQVFGSATTDHLFGHEKTLQTASRFFHPVEVLLQSRSRAVEQLAT